MTDSPRQPSGLPDKWPPLIYKSNVPLWVKVRDVGLTLTAWIFIVFLLHDFLKLVYDYLKDPIFTLQIEDTPDWAKIWDRLDLFVYFAIFLVVIIISASITRKSIIIRRDLSDDQPEQVKIERIETQYGISSEQLIAWDKERIFAVNYDIEGQIVNVKSSASK